MGAFRFPVECPGCHREFGARLRVEADYDMSRLQRAFTMFGRIELANACPQHPESAWEFMDSPAWELAERKCGLVDEDTEDDIDDWPVA